MSDLVEQINKELIESLKAKDEVKVSTLRMLSAAFKNAEIAKGGELTEEEIIGQISKSAKQHKESIAAYEAGGRQDLVDREKEELEILEKYLPKQMNEEEIAKIVVEVIGQTGAIGVSDTGKVIGAVMAKVKGMADGNIVSRIVREKLG